MFLEKMARYAHSMNGVPVDRVSIPAADLLRLIRMVDTSGGRPQDVCKENAALNARLEMWERKFIDLMNSVNHVAVTNHELNELRAQNCALQAQLDASSTARC